MGPFRRFVFVIFFFHLPMQIVRIYILFCVFFVPPFVSRVRSCVLRITEHEIVMKMNVDDVYSAKRGIAMFHNDCMEHTRWQNVF